MRFDRDKFFAGFRPYYRQVTGGALDQDKVEALELLLTQFENDAAWVDVREVAYALATMHIETYWPRSGDRYMPISEGGGAAYFKKYDGRKDLGNTEAGDGARFKGRGYVQITGRRNYTKFSKLLGVDLVGEPDLALHPVTAFKIMSIGMHQGKFTSKKLSDFIHGDECDYFNARTIINGHDRAGEIAGYAHHFENILTAALSDESSEAAPSPTRQDGAGTAGDPTGPDLVPAGGDTGSQEQPPTSPGYLDRFKLWKQKTDDATSQLTDVQTTVSNVTNTLSPVAKVSKSSWLTALGTKAWGFILMVWGALADHPLYAILGTVLIVAGIWYLTRAKDRAKNATQVQQQKVVVNTAEASA